MKGHGLVKVGFIQRVLHYEKMWFEALQCFVLDYELSDNGYLTCVVGFKV